MAKIGNEAKLILKLASERRLREMAVLNSRFAATNDELYKMNLKGQLSGLELMMTILRNIHTEIESER